MQSCESRTSYSVGLIMISRRCRLFELVGLRSFGFFPNAGFILFFSGGGKFSPAGLNWPAMLAWLMSAGHQLASPAELPAEVN